MKIFKLEDVFAVTFEDGVTMDVWVDRYGRKDGRDEEARQAFQRIFILTDVRFGDIHSMTIVDSTLQFNDSFEQKKDERFFFS